MTGTKLSSGVPGDDDFRRRCDSAGVIRCFGFDSPNDIQKYLHNPAADGVQRLVFDPEMKASGGGSMRADVPAITTANTSGAFAINFTDDYSFQVGPGEEVFIQWRQRFDDAFVQQQPNPGNGWKQFILSEGSTRTRKDPGSCTEMHLVVENTYYRGFPTLYHSCVHFESLQFYSNEYRNWLLQNATSPKPCVRESEKFPPCVGYKANQWMTFQLHVKVGSWYTGGQKKNDSWIQFWIAEEGKPSQLVLDVNPNKGYGGVPPTGWNLWNSDPNAKYGRIWLLPYTTDRQETSTCSGKPCRPARTWYDELIVSKTRIPDPQH